MSDNKLDQQEKSKKEKNVHAGHRERMRQKFLENGLATFYEHEILEFLLFYVHSRANTNEIGHELIDTFGSLKGVLDAEYDDLLQVKGVGQRGATLIKFLPELLKAYNSSMCANESLRTVDERCRFFHKQLMFETQEVVILACLNDKLHLQRCIEIGRGVPDHVQIDNQKLLRAAIHSKCNCVMLAHNHPKGIANPSYEDVRVTDSIATFLKTVNIDLVDHIIVGDGKAISMHQTGSFCTK